MAVARRDDARPMDSLPAYRSGVVARVFHGHAPSHGADFIGHTNLLPGEMVSEEDGKYVIETKAGRFVASANGRVHVQAAVG